ncbi:acyltransferase family protein [Mycobacteroides salmoniphilum]|uniref:acyltransferase family protein n=1 Tax=Mycobacteroides salmoniphilum TaxID=404941 RepID=UPI001F3BC0E6|nr:acyltransferase [Mycobacteroides salmoniphilum]
MIDMGREGLDDSVHPDRSIKRTSDNGAEARPAREFSLDLYRVSAVLIVVLGHWVASAVSYQDGHFIYLNVLVEMPWTQWLTLIFQVVPVFFVVAGYANAASWTRWRDAHGDRTLDWIRHRVTTTLGPTTVYVAAALAVVGVLSGIGIGGSPLELGAWAIAMHLWFLPVYLVTVSLTPWLVAAHRRRGVAVLIALTLCVAAIDIATFGAGAPVIGVTNYLFVWAAIYQIGIAWFGGALQGRRPILLSAGAAATLAALVWLGPYPVSMLGVPGQAVHNSSPPTIALLAFAATQSGLLLAAAPAVTRWLQRSRRQPLLTMVNANVMALYLWHMIAVVVVVLIGYPGHLMPQPALGSGAWWLSRVMWVAILVALTAAIILLLSAMRACVWRRTRAISVVALRASPRWLTALWLLVGTAMAAMALAQFAVAGFAPGGKFPTLAALVYAAGVGLVAMSHLGALDQDTSEAF